MKNQKGWIGKMQFFGPSLVEKYTLNGKGKYKKQHGDWGRDRVEKQIEFFFSFSSAKEF